MNHSQLAIWAVLLLTALAGPGAQAQRLMPLARLQADGQAPFPFYDDFSRATGQPDPLRWEAGGGAYVNYSYGLMPPTLGSAALDGLDSTGTPYAFESPSALGLADRLTSLPIDLSGQTPADPPVLSFYWQARGWGEQPNADDSLLLEFLHPNGTWVRQWGVSADSLTEFRLEELTISNTAYYYGGFQFRFVNYARLSGPYDTWNLDYIYLNRASAANTPSVGIVRDLGFGGAPPVWLRDYTQMPLSAFLAAGRGADTLRTVLRNVRTGGIGDNTTHLFATRVYADGQLVRDETIPAHSVNADGLASSQGTIFLRKDEVVEVAAPSELSLSDWATASQVRIEHQFFLFENAEALNAVPTQHNDTMTVVTELGSAYAYDDGSAELGWGINKKFGKFAVEFETPVDWRVDAVDIHIARVGRRLTQGGFRVGIWQYIDTVDAANDVVLSPMQYHSISYTDSLNAFQRFSLGRTVNIPAGKFYVVVEQLTDELLPIGFDVHHDRSEKLFINLSDTRWRPQPEFGGALLLRPVQREGTVTALPREEALPGLAAYPNPTTGQVRWTEPVEAVEAYDLQGRRVAQWERASGQEAVLELGGLPKGLYLLRFHSQGQTASRRVVLR